VRQEARARAGGGGRERAAEGTLTEQHPAATVTWLASDGQVKARIGADGTPIDKGVTGTVTAKPLTEVEAGDREARGRSDEARMYSATLPPRPIRPTSRTDVSGALTGTLHSPRRDDAARRDEEG
jgi:hypothetical protein